MNYHTPAVALRLLRLFLLLSWDLRPRLVHAVALRLRTKTEQEKVAAKSETAICRTAQAEPARQGVPRRSLGTRCIEMPSTKPPHLTHFISDFREVARN